LGSPGTAPMLENERLMQGDLAQHDVDPAYPALC
jgi:hypothetical protein